ncbi:Uncharacterised protein [Candidatus Burarchaeum australiense]|nr:Uncharacterised protein [Candidatus Burarchaeum australiense]
MAQTTSAGLALVQRSPAAPKVSVGSVTSSEYLQRLIAFRNEWFSTPVGISGQKPVDLPSELRHLYAKDKSGGIVRHMPKVVPNEGQRIANLELIENFKEESRQKHIDRVLATDKYARINDLNTRKGAAREVETWQASQTKLLEQRGPTMFDAYEQEQMNRYAKPKNGKAKRRNGKG